MAAFQSGSTGAIADANVHSAGVLPAGTYWIVISNSGTVTALLGNSATALNFPLPASATVYLQVSQFAGGPMLFASGNGAQVNWMTGA